MPNDDRRPQQPAAPGNQPGPDGSGFARPAGVSDGFVQRPPVRQSRPQAPPPSPDAARAFGRPQGVPGSFTGQGRPPQPMRPVPPPPSHAYQAAFSRPSGAPDLQRQPGQRPYAVEIRESPWWKPDAPRDPWRDPSAYATLTTPEQETDEDVEPESVIEPDAKQRRRLRLKDFPLRLAVVLTLGTLLLGLASGATGFLLAKRASEAPLIKAEPEFNTVNNTKAPTSIGEVAAKVQPSIVSIQVLTSSGGAGGSGVVIDPDGYILTNNHVAAYGINDDQQAISVFFADGSISPAQLVGRDPKADLAVLKVDKPGLVPIDIGASENVQVGDDVIAFGSPLGLAGTVTSGIVSTLDRAVHLPGEGEDPDAYFLAVQTDASINHGSSGGGLVDSQGALVGINTAGASGGTDVGNLGLNFAIPVTYAMSIAEQLIKGETPEHGDLQLSGESVQDDTSSGVRVVQLEQGGAAAAAGVGVKDVIVEADGKKLSTLDELMAIAYHHKPGDTISLVVITGTQSRTVQVTLA